MDLLVPGAGAGIGRADGSEGADEAVWADEVASTDEAVRTVGGAAWFFSRLKGMVSKSRMNKEVVINGLRITRVLTRGEGILSIYEKPRRSFGVFHQ